MQKRANGFAGRSSEALGNEQNRRILLLTGLSLATALVLASLYPPPLLLAVFSNLLLLMALATGVMAIVLTQRPLADHLNFWDKAALLTFAGLAIGMLVDTEAVLAFMEAQTSGSADAKGTATEAGNP
ncbi:MAG: hypothetical protein ACR2PO_15625 [Methyloligellaceae bacterium]